MPFAHSGKDVRTMKPRRIQLLLAIVLTSVCSVAETGYVMLRVEDVHGHPVRNLQIGLEKGVSVLTKEGDRHGLADGVPERRRNPYE
jgi:hypothetical protein